jgi:DNA polymerase III subunit chi
MPQITFHVVTEAAPDAHLRVACRLAEEAVDQGQQVFVRVADDAQAKRIDDLLWTFGDRSFLPHELATSPDHQPSHQRIRVLIGTTVVAHSDCVINIAVDLPPNLGALKNVIELVPADDTLKRAARARFKSYRDAGFEPVTQNA